MTSQLNAISDTEDMSEEEGEVSQEDATLFADALEPGDITQNENITSKKIGTDESLKSNVSEEEDDDDEYMANDNHNYEDDETSDDDNYDEEIFNLEKQIDIMKKIAPTQPEETAEEESVVDVSRSNKRAAEEDLEVKPVKKSKNIEEIKCFFCEKVFENAQDLLRHLSQTHFGKKIFDKYPLEQDGTCKICIEEDRKKKFIMKSRTPYYYHMGKVHLRALEFLDHKQQIEMITLLKIDPNDASLAFLSSNDLDVQVSLEEAVEKGESFEEEIIQSKEEVEEDTQKHGNNKANNVDNEETAEIESTNLLKVKKSKKRKSNDCKGNINEISSDSPLKVKGSVIGGHLKCSMCDDNKELFKKSTLLLHLSTSHLSKELGARFKKEDIKDQEQCSFCLEEKKPRVYKIHLSRFSDYLRHVGAIHEQVKRWELNFL